MVHVYFVGLIFICYFFFILIKWAKGKLTACQCWSRYSSQIIIAALALPWLPFHVFSPPSLTCFLPFHFRLPSLFYFFFYGKKAKKKS
ncbi:hypothetical protein GDO86_006656 [Hymenochirus boettgeri]|uniref:Uncharacterized protein n=1 Tax=Hymenochirus boettgeri TaxID=247094 RepID=A0A8T2J9H2_9PIPI|nr:hypothetical protein GDO86_006656 [Hymenochirus boettgeri]